MIVEEIIEYANALAGTKTLTDIRIGLGTTAILLSDGNCGLGFTLAETNSHCHVLDEAGTLAGRMARDLTGWAMAPDPVKASVGIALINALLSPAATGFVNENAMDAIDIRPGDTVGMVGCFMPVIRKHGQRIGKLYVFERVPAGENTYPDWAEDIYLPQCDVAIITGTTLINKTIDHVLSLCAGAHEIVLMGATTCLCPDVFRAHGVHMIAGTRVIDAARALQVVSESGGTPGLRSCTEHLCTRL